MNADFLNLLAQTVLEFTHEPVIVPLLVIGYIGIGRHIFSHAICLLFLSMIFNAALKATFQIPLNPLLGKGFAFPSGHMQTAVVLYGYLYTALNKSNALRFGIVCLLLMIGTSLIYCGYHNIFDIVGAVFFGALLLSGYQYVQKLVNQQMLGLLSWAFATLCLMYLYSVHVIPSHLEMAYYALIGFTMAASFIERYLPKKEQTNYQKIITILICFGCLFVLNFIFSAQVKMIATLASLRWFSLGVAIPLSLLLGSWIFQKKAVVFKRIK